MFGINNPQSLLRPWKNLTEFVENFYTMLSKPDDAVEHRGPVTLRAKPNEPALRIVRDQPGDTSYTFGGKTTKLSDNLASDSARQAPAFQVPAQPDRPQSKTKFADTYKPPSFLPITAPAIAFPNAPSPPPVTPFPSYAPPAAVPSPPIPVAPFSIPSFAIPAPIPPSTPVLFVQGPARFAGPDPVQFDRVPQFLDPGTHKYFDAPWFKPKMANLAADAGSITLMGKVVSGSGDTYTVQLYSSGPGNPKDDGLVTVTIPTADPDDSLPGGTWLSPVCKFQNDKGADVYYCQPPVWIS